MACRAFSTRFISTCSICAGVGAHRQRRLAELIDDLYIPLDEFAQRATHAVDQAIEIEDRGAEGLAPAESAQPFSNRGRPPGGLENLAEGLPQPFVDAFLEGQRGVAHDHGQEVIEVVRDASGHASQGFLALRLAQFLFQPNALAPVACDQSNGTGIPFAFTHGEGAHEHRDALMGETMAPFQLTFPQAGGGDGGIHLDAHGIVRRRCRTLRRWAS